MRWEKVNTVKRLLKVFTESREKAFPYHSCFKISQLQSVSTNLSMKKSSLQFAGRIMGLEAHWFRILPWQIFHLPRLNCLKSFDVIAPQIALLQDVLAAKMVWNAHLPVVIVKALHVQMEVQWMWQKKILMKLMIKIEAFLNPKTENVETCCIDWGLMIKEESSLK